MSSCPDDARTGCNGTLQGNSPAEAIDGSWDTSSCSSSVTLGRSPPGHTAPSPTTFRFRSAPVYDVRHFMPVSPLRPCSKKEKSEDEDEEEAEVETDEETVTAIGDDNNDEYNENDEDTSIPVLIVSDIPQIRESIVRAPAHAPAPTPTPVLGASRSRRSNVRGPHDGGAGAVCAVTVAPLGAVVSLSHAIPFARRLSQALIANRPDRDINGLRNALRLALSIPGDEFSVMAAAPSPPATPASAISSPIITTAPGCGTPP
ncbi:hypothetical protein F5Y14DRAFT_446254 [Nemania sp. NC0429]|nr:hypothetical protein F5Y14DRAFT_446254 [Nemania sp. NC0429]